ncbi:NAD(P)-binding protein [Teratosphaeria nubilosa]|uniref:NAD(P)-binding protein n=1 Tax=Teratosphaeria nubilosa TaxID=161662 RepID=A0A6G1LPA9_9PEZI|nr:NAD(P)-binding protein [Teratosphaeria nubilosa]
MPLAVVTGANSGIGHAFAQLLLDQDVHACDHIVGANLQALPARLHRLDVRSPESIAGLAAQLANKPIHLLLNIAGIMAPPAQDTLATTSKNILTTTFEINAFGPLLLTQALLPNLVLAPEQDEEAKVGIAAVNSVGKSLSVDLREKGVVVCLLHPGVVRTNLNPEAEHAEAVEAEEAAAKLWEVVRRVGVEETGRFWHREGYELPW